MPDESPKEPDYKDRTFAITASKDMRADDVDLVAGAQIAVITSPINVRTLLGLIQYHGFRVEEVTTGDDSQEDESADSPEGQSPDTAGPAPVVSQEEGTVTGDLSEQPPADETPATPEAVDTSIQQFIADGLDEKTATILAEQKLTPAALRELIAEDYDLMELEGIGETRVKKILQVYPKPASE